MTPELALFKFLFLFLLLLLLFAGFCVCVGGVTLCFLKWGLVLPKTALNSMF